MAQGSFVVSQETKVLVGPGEFESADRLLQRQGSSRLESGRVSSLSKSDIVGASNAAGGPANCPHDLHVRSEGALYLV